MNNGFDREWRRWLNAEAGGDDETADTALGAVFRGVPRQAPRPDFADRVMRAVALERARRTRRFAVAATAAIGMGALVTVGVVVALVVYGPRVLLGAVDLTVEATLWAIAALDRGLDVWSLLAQVGRTAGAVIAAPEVITALAAVGLVGIGALYGLHRLLMLEQESSR